VVAGLLGESGAGDVGGVGVALHLGERDRGLGQPAVGEGHAVEGVLPPLVEQSGVGCPLVLDEAIAVAVAVALDPVQRPVRSRQQLGDVGRIGAPEVQLTEQLHEQRGCVDAAVVDSSSGQRVCRVGPEPHLVQDLAGLLLAAGLDLGALEAGQRAQRAQRETGVQQQSHPRREQ
jgi:hypothetical protein